MVNHPIASQQLDSLQTKSLNWYQGEVLHLFLVSCLMLNATHSAIQSCSDKRQVDKCVFFEVGLKHPTTTFESTYVTCYYPPAVNINFNILSWDDWLCDYDPPKMLQNDLSGRCRLHTRVLKHGQAGLQGIIKQSNIRICYAWKEVSHYSGIVKPCSKSKPLFRQTPKLNISPQKKEKRKIWTKGWQ